MLKSDYHVHSNYCDGADTIKDMANEAVSRGLTAIGFSTHSPLHPKYGMDYQIKDEKVDDYIADGWLADLNLEPVMHTSQETGETHVAALRLDNVPALAEIGAINNNGAVLMIMWNSTNLETSMDVVEHMIRSLVEGTYASAESTQPAA